MGNRNGKNRKEKSEKSLNDVNSHPSKSTSAITPNRYPERVPNGTQPNLNQLRAQYDQEKNSKQYYRTVSAENNSPHDSMERSHSFPAESYLHKIRPPSRSGTPVANIPRPNLPKLIYVANHDFIGEAAKKELSFMRGDKLEIIDRSTYLDWWEATNLRTKQNGYVPSNYISPINDLTVFEWYFSETNRREAERFLEQPQYDRGTFLVRPSDTNPGQESLSVLDLTPDKHFHVKHYRINRNEQGMYYISKKQCFQNLPKLVAFYQVKVDGLCCLLTVPCRKIEPTLPGDRHGLLELDRSQLVRTNFIGKGNYGEVYRGKYGQRDVAIKSMKTDAKNRLRNKDEFLGEAKTMKNLLHKNILRLYGVCTEEEPIFIVTEYMANGCLLNYLRDGAGKNLKFKNLLDYAAQIAKGMAYLEQKLYVHCDLAARNILVGEADIVKIGDFGLAKILQGGRFLVDREAQFPIKWTAPEAATKKVYTHKSDVWSFGVLLYELITYGSNPYPGMSNTEALQAVLSGYRMSKPTDCHDYYYKIMFSCWQENPDNRPTFEALFSQFDDFLIQSEPSYREN